METLTAQWLASTNEAQAQKLLDDVQRSALITVPVAPLGQIIPKTAYRRNLQGILRLPATLEGRGWCKAIRLRSKCPPEGPRSTPVAEAQQRDE